eukprot:scaffold191028_cov31-Attheya_sp.AAC.1
MQRMSDQDGTDLHNGLKSQHRDSAGYISDALVKEDSAVGCHFGRREFGLRRVLCEIYATTHSIVQTQPAATTGRAPGRLLWMFVPSEKCPIRWCPINISRDQLFVSLHTSEPYGEMCYRTFYNRDSRRFKCQANFGPPNWFEPTKKKENGH